KPEFDAMVADMHSAQTTMGLVVMSPFLVLGAVELAPIALSNITYTGLGKTALWNGGINLGTQLATNGMHFGEVNIIDLGFSTVTSGFTSTLLGSTFQYSINDGFKVNSLKGIGVELIANQAVKGVHGKFG